MQLLAESPVEIKAAAPDVLPHVTVHGYGEAWGFPDLSPFVIKVLFYLKAQGFPFTHVVASPRNSPRGKLPWVEVNGQQISDTRNIIEYLESIHPAPLDAWLSAEQRAHVRPLKSMLEEHLYFIALCGRWVYDDGFAVLQPKLLDYLGKTGVPSFLAPMVVKMIRGAVKKQAFAQGTGRLSREEHVAVAREIYSALDAALGDKPFIFGDRPCTLDCTMGAFTTLALIDAFQHEVAQLIRSYPRLVAYARLSHERYRQR